MWTRPLVLLLLSAIAPRAAAGGEVPDPLLWASEPEFVKEVEAGQFADRLELHLLQYAADPGWRTEWAAARYSGSGLFAEYGSTTGTELYSNTEIAVNAFPLEKLQIRFDRREYEDGRIDVYDERLDALWYAGSRWAVVLSGFPAFDKERSSMGAGLRIGAPRSESALELRLVDERFVWNEKTDGTLRFTRQPLRFLADGFVAAGPWRLRASIDAMREWSLEDRGPPEAGGGRSARGSRRFADLEAERTWGAWSAAARVTGATVDRHQADAAGAAYHLDRSWIRALLSARRDAGRWCASALAGVAFQRDEFSSPAAPGGVYAQDTMLLGAEAGVRPAPGLLVQLGYLASAHRATRKGVAGAPLPAKSEEAYLDKAHLRASYAFAPRMSIEALLSQALRGGEFGGGSMRALLAF